jgi:PAS domain S-box-containing protein
MHPKAGQPMTVSILVVEDESIVAMDIKSTLEGMGYSVPAVVNSGEKAIIAATEQKPDIILMDIQLEGKMDGIEAASRIRSDSSIPIIFLTASAEKDKLERAKLTLPFGYLLKPIQDRDLKVTIEMAIYASEVDTEREQSKEALQKSDERYRRITDAVTDYIYTVRVKDSMAVETEHGENCFAVTGYTREEFQADPYLWHNIVKEEDRDFVRQQASNILYNEEVESFEHRIIRKDSKECWVLNSIVPELNKEGVLISYDGLIRNITKRKQAEEALQRANDRLEKEVDKRTTDYKIAKEEAEIANKLKSAFLANISHELRTPTHHILSYSKFGVEKINNVSKEKLLHYFSQIRITGVRLLLLLNDLLDVSKLESGRMDYQMKKTNLGLMVENLISVFSSAAHEKSISLEMDKAELSTVVICDESKIDQVLYNLLSNAVKFTPAGKSITISFDPHELAVEKGLTNKKTVSALRIRIKDEGIGIPENELETIFDKFIQSSKPKSNIGGTGLGLAICQEIISAHQGRIWAENTQEGGAIFSFVLPYQKI